MTVIKSQPTSVFISFKNNDYETETLSIGGSTIALCNGNTWALNLHWITDRSWELVGQPGWDTPVSLHWSLGQRWCYLATRTTSPEDLIALSSRTQNTKKVYQNKEK
jgi:hypothetical protein